MVTDNGQMSIIKVERIRLANKIIVEVMFEDLFEVMN